MNCLVFACRQNRYGNDLSRVTGTLPHFARALSFNTQRHAPHALRISTSPTPIHSATRCHWLAARRSSSLGLLMRCAAHLDSIDLRHLSFNTPDDARRSVSGVVVF